MTSDPGLLTELAEEAATVADLLQAQFELERASAEENQTRLLAMLCGTFTQNLQRYLRDPQGRYIRDPEGHYVEVPPGS